ncbi:septal ring lytic transglycosylase RlpA family protein [Belnapia sp. T6]|uniref:Endolytic peptidoglycan transglycosylase RlpA n=1 Tax=Belnapia mucosa TaxID=2804532 RepID=A0ABS1VCJ2_9PROT|nr:septal ring lytic transglycosylase RlpA family protein [Belnapia mucosa]MBL6459389.1 septal ring lytic transglycosylase RlpA family protein [Belnapia mucosa]
MRRLGVLIVCVLLGHGWTVHAEAASQRHRTTSVRATTGQPASSGRSVHRAGHHAHSGTRRRSPTSGARLKPGREVIDHSGRPQHGRASYYGRDFNGRKMANGRPFNPNSNIAASRSLPLGTVARVRNRQTQRETIVKVEDRGPYVPGRILDVAPRAADDLGMREQGVAPVTVEPIVIPRPDNNDRSGRSGSTGQEQP